MCHLPSQTFLLEMCAYFETIFPFLCFRVIVLDKGEIKEMDSPENLLKDENSLFYAMAKDAGLISWTLLLLFS